MIKHLHKITAVQLFIVFIVLLFLSAWTLRQNNQHMGELRAAVLVADQNNKNIEGSLVELRNYIFSHMNTGMAQPIELVSSFNRSVNKARKKAEQVDVGNSVYARAQAECEDPSIPLNVRAQCIQDYVVQNAEPGSVITELDIPPKELFVYDYQSPVWSADLAGFTVMLTAFTGLVLLVKLAIARLSFLNK